MITTLISNTYFEDMEYRDFLDSGLRQEAFRIDMRSPEIIQQVGFRGSIINLPKWPYPAFGYSTVFCSATIEGSIYFCNLLDENPASPKEFYFYRIDIRGLDVIAVPDNWGTSGESERSQERRMKFMEFLCNNSPRKRVHNEPFQTYLIEVGKFIGAHLKFDELLVRGPILPGRIAYIGRGKKLN